jgi:hypothetical protein
MASEFEELRLTITLTDDASAGIKSLRQAHREAAQAKAGQSMAGSGQNMQKYSHGIDQANWKLTAFAGAVGYFQKNIDTIASTLFSLKPTNEFAKERVSVENAAKLLGIEVGHLQNVIEQGSAKGIGPESSKRIVGRLVDLRLKLSHAGGRTALQMDLKQYQLPPNAGRDYVMFLSEQKNFYELSKAVIDTARGVEKDAIARGVAPDIAKKLAVDFVVAHGLPAELLLFEEITVASQEYLDRQKKVAEAARRWHGLVTQFSKNLNSILGKVMNWGFSEDGPFLKALRAAQEATEFIAKFLPGWNWLKYHTMHPELILRDIMPFGRWGTDPTLPLRSLEPKKQKFEKEIDDLYEHVRKANYDLVGPTGPRIVPAAYGGAAGAAPPAYGTRPLPDFSQGGGGGGGGGGGPTTSAPTTPGGGGQTGSRAPAVSGPQVATRTPSGAAPPSAPAAAPGTPQAGEQPIIDYSAQAGLRSGGQMDKVQGMVVHHTSGVYGGRNAAGVSDVLRSRGFSSTFFIDRDGQIYRLTPEGRTAFHTKPGGTGTLGAAGAGFGNQNLEGVEIEARNDADVLPIQRAAAANLIGQRSRLHGYDPTKTVFGHGELNRDKERDEGMSTVSRIRSGELSTAIGAPMPASQPRAPEEATPVRPHPLLGAGQGQEFKQGGFTPIPPGALKRFAPTEAPSSAPGHTAVDRKVIDQSLGNEIRTEVSGDANVSIDVAMAPKNSGNAADGLFKPDVIERQTTMQETKHGPSIGVT